MIHLTVGGTNMRQYIYFAILIALISLFAMSYRIEYGKKNRREKEKRYGVK